MTNMQIGRNTRTSIPFQSPYSFGVPVLQNIKKTKTYLNENFILIFGEQMEEKKEGTNKVNGHAKFDENHRLVMPNLKKKKTAQELIKEIPDSPKQRKIDREIAAIEQKQQQKKIKRPRHKEVKAETMVEKLCRCDGITSYYNNYDHVIKFNGKTCMWISDRQYGIAVSTWGPGGKDWKTTRIYNQQQMYQQIELLKDRLKNENG